MTEPDFEQIAKWLFTFPSGDIGVQGPDEAWWMILEHDVADALRQAWNSGRAEYLIETARDGEKP